MRREPAAEISLRSVDSDTQLAIQRHDQFGFTAGDAAAAGHVAGARTLARHLDRQVVRRYLRRGRLLEPFDLALQTGNLLTQLPDLTRQLCRRIRLRASLGRPPAPGTRWTEPAQQQQKLDHVDGQNGDDDDLQLTPRDDKRFHPRSHCRSAASLLLRREVVNLARVPLGNVL